MRVSSAGWVVTGLVSALAAAPAMAQSLGEPRGIYSCTDAQGRRLTADRPITACLDREQRVLGPSGVERGRVGPSLSDSERAQRDAQRRQQLQDLQRAKDDARRQRLLVQRYPDQVSHDAERAAAIAQVDEVAALARGRVAELRSARVAIDAEMEFYAKDPVHAPTPLRRQVAQSDEALAEQARFIAVQEQEKQRIHQRFDAELTQLRRLWGAAP